MIYCLPSPAFTLPYTFWYDYNLSYFNHPFIVMIWCTTGRCSVLYLYSHTRRDDVRQPVMFVNATFGPWGSTDRPKIRRYPWTERSILTYDDVWWMNTCQSRHRAGFVSESSGGPLWQLCPFAVMDGGGRVVRTQKRSWQPGPSSVMIENILAWLCFHCVRLFIIPLEFNN